MQFHLFVIISFIEHNFHKIILNIYFDHTHIRCLYRVFSVHWTDYMLVCINVEVWFVLNDQSQDRWKAFSFFVYFLLSFLFKIPHHLELGSAPSPSDMPAKP